MKRPIVLGLAAALALCAAPALADSPSPLPSPSPAVASGVATDAAVELRARDWIGRMQAGTIDRSQLTAKMNAAMTNDVIASLA